VLSGSMTDEARDDDTAPTADDPRIAATYDAVAERYAAAMVNELEERPIERGLLDALVALTAPLGKPLADLGCGPGHITRYLADRGANVVGIDLSPQMIEVARRRFPGLALQVGSMTQLAAEAGAWSGAALLYSIIHLTAEERGRAFAELARVVCAGGYVLVSFHVASAAQPAGSALELARWFDTDVDLTTYFLDPAEILGGLRRAGFSLQARLDRQPLSSHEYPSQRAYLLMQRA
jgi:ubiquinone/menaquinone biosynthesis C-methylase UbiE